MWCLLARLSSCEFNLHSALIILLRIGRVLGLLETYPDSDSDLSLAGLQN